MEKTVNLAFDMETDGLDSTRIHCIVTQDLDTGLVEEYNNLMACDNIVSHNGIAYDIAQAQKHYPFFRELKAKHWDTLILSRFYHPNLLDIDLTRKWRDMPAKLYGSHSLEAYGYRLRCRKGDYGKTTSWKDWTPEMQEYCKQDVAVLTKLWKHFQKYLNPSS